MKRKGFSLSHFVDRQKLPLLATPKVVGKKIDPPKTCEIDAKRRERFTL